MKFMTSVYRQALLKDFKGPVNQANAYNLQQVLYENQSVFGNLYKFENFRNVFTKPPVSSELVTFITFWKGVESVLEDKFEGVSVVMYDTLHKSCFVDDEYVESMRFFRDEILKNEMSLTKSELLESINKSQKNSNLTEFWSKVFENTKKMFKQENVSVHDISNMVFNFFLKKYSGDVYLESEPDRLTTSLSEEELVLESKSARTESAAEFEESLTNSKEFKFDESFNSWDYEYKYRKLLCDLENSLPKFYTYYSEAKSELSETKEEVRKLMEKNDSMSNQFSKENMELIEKNTYLESQLKEALEKNENLKELLVSKDSEIESLAKEVEKVNHELETSDAKKLAEELQVYMAKCQGLQKTNEGLKSAILEMEGLLEAVKSSRDNAEEDAETIQRLVTERDNLLEDLKKNETEYNKVCEELKELTLNNEKLNSELNESKTKVSKYVENELKLNNENLKALNELKALKRENEVLEEQCVKAREEREYECNKVKELKEEVERLTEYNKELEEKQKELESYREKTSQMEQQVEEMNNLNEHLKEKLNDVVQENISLVAKLELMNIPSPKNATNKLMDMIEKYKDVQSPISYESETTDYDFSDPSEPSTMENRLKINPDLAETRRLNTLNAIKFGLVKTNSDRTGEKEERNELGPMVYRKTNSFPRLDGVKENYRESNFYENLSLGKYDGLGISESSDRPDILQNAISYFSKKLNFK